MKTPLSTIWLLCIHCGLAAPPSARGQTTILSEGFEGIFPGDWLVANFDPDGSEVYWGKVNSAFGGEGTHSGSSKAYCAGIGFFGTSANPSYDTYMMSVMARGINLAGYSDATLTFWHKIPSIETGFDDASVLIDNQVIWSSGSPESAWTQVTIPLTGFVGGVHTLAFFFSSDDSVTFEGWYLDDILVTARNAATPPTLRLSPAKGPVGRAVSVSALGFPAGDAGRPALVLFDGGIVATQTLAACSNPSDGAGFGLLCNGAPANTIVPPASDGPHIFKATEGNFQGQLAPEATFVVDLAEEEVA